MCTNRRFSFSFFLKKNLLGIFDLIKFDRWKSVNSSDRLAHPLIRRNGKLEQASWNEAMELIVEKSKEVIDRITKHGIAFYTTGQLFLEEYYALALIGKAGLNTLHMDGNTRLCTATAAASMRESFGSDGQPGSYSDIDFTDCLFMVGHNMAATQTVLWSRVLDRLDSPNPPKLIVVDPRMSDTAKRATVHLAPRIGTNMALLNGIQKLLFDNHWIDEEFVQKHTVGVAELRATISSYTPEHVEEITGVPPYQLQEAARVIGTAPSLLSTALQGVYQSNQATASACQINNINLLTGHIGRAGSGVLQMNGQPTAQNNRETGCDGEFPGFRNHMNPTHMEELAELWNIESIKVPHWNEPTHIENLLNYIEKGSIEMFWISGTNPLVSLPNLPRVRSLLTKQDLFVICQDIYMTETAAIADVVLPAAQWAEKNGCFTNVDRTVHLSHKAVDPPGEAKSDLDIFLDYSKRMDFRDKSGNPLMPWTKPEEVFEAWKRLSKGRPCDYSGLTYEKLTGGSGIQWPCTEQHPNGKERLFDNAHFFTDIDYCESFGHDLETGTPYSKEDYKVLNPAGRAILKACHFVPAMEEPDDHYPLRLSTGRTVHHFHTRTKTGRTDLQDACPEPEIVISEEDAGSFNVKDGEMVVVRSARGAVEMKARTGGVSVGQTFIPFHFGYWDNVGGRARAANELTVGKCH
jgi:ferredoxin-nitrate reductase